jgi:hypothetical protein
MKVIFVALLSSLICVYSMSQISELKMQDNVPQCKIKSLDDSENQIEKDPITDISKYSLATFKKEELTENNNTSSIQGDFLKGVFF